MSKSDKWTCFSFGLPYLLYGLEGQVEFRVGGHRWRAELTRHKHAEGKVSILDDPFGRTDYTGVRLCLEGLVALDLEHLVPDERKSWTDRFGHAAGREYKAQLHRVLIEAVNELIAAYTFAWGAWRLAPVQFADLTGYSASYTTPEGPSGKIVRSLQPDPDESVLALLRQSLIQEDKLDTLRRFFDAPAEVKSFYQFEMTAARALLRRELVVAVITCVSSVEVYVNAVLREWASGRHVEVERLRGILKQKKGVTVNEVIGFSSLDRKLKHGLEGALGIRLADTTFWSRWCATVTARDRAAHAGASPSFEDAVAALITARNLFRTIEGARGR